MIDGSCTYKTEYKAMGSFYVYSDFGIAPLFGRFKHGSSLPAVDRWRGTRFSSGIEHIFTSVVDVVHFIV